jgi:hypothetical protein
MKYGHYSREKKMEIFIAIISTLFTSQKTIEFVVTLLTKMINKIEENKELKKQWAIFTKEINKSIPVRMSDETIQLLKEITEEERIKDQIDKRKNEQLKTYEVNNKELYAKTLSLQDRLNQVEGGDRFKGEF